VFSQTTGRTSTLRTCHPPSPSSMASQPWLSLTLQSLATSRTLISVCPIRSLASPTGSKRSGNRTGPDSNGPILLPLSDAQTQFGDRLGCSNASTAMLRYARTVLCSVSLDLHMTLSLLSSSRLGASRSATSLAPFPDGSLRFDSFLLCAHL
jgi:hypothetical protein